MVIKEYGDSKLPKVVLLHPMLSDGECCPASYEALKMSSDKHKGKV